MSRNGSGTYTLPAGNPVVTGTTIASTWANNTLSDIASALTDSVAADGQTPMTGNLNLNSNKIVNVADPTLAQDAATKNYSDTTYLAKASNLSDVANATTSRTNISAAKSGANSDITSLTGLTTPLSQAQGGTGTTTGYYGFKNRIINGAMVIDQRSAGASQTITAAAALAYTVDRWYAYSTGANVTGQRVAGSGATQYRYQFTGASSTTKIGFAQRIEQLNSYDLAGSVATLSVDLANSLLTTVTWVASYANTADTFGTLASPTITQIATGTFTVSSTVTNYNAQITVPSAATTGIQIEFSVAAQTSGTWTIGNVQLEKGSTATSFDYRPYGTELALCQRYYEKTSGVIQGSLSSVNGQGNVQWYYKVTKRATPTVTGNNATTDVAVNTVDFAQGTTNNTGGFFATFASGSTASAEL